MKQKNLAMIGTFRRTMAVAVAALVSTVALAQGVIQGVTGSIQGGTEVLRIDLTEPLSALPHG